MKDEGGVYAGFAGVLKGERGQAKSGKENDNAGEVVLPTVVLRAVPGRVTGREDQGCSHTVRKSLLQLEASGGAREPRTEH